ncbi:hypothetical protein LSH36_314g03004, partial [Paralvinella palmiformis]
RVHHGHKQAVKGPESEEGTDGVFCKETSKTKGTTRRELGKESAEDQGGEVGGLESGLRNSPCAIQGLPTPQYKATHEQGGTHHSLYDQGETRDYIVAITTLNGRPVTFRTVEKGHRKEIRGYH